MTVRVESDLPFDPSDVAVAPATPGVPVVAYSEACPPNVAGTGLECTTDPGVLSSIPLDTASFGAYVPVRSIPPTVPLVASSGGLVHVSPFTAPSEPFVFAIRSDRHGIIELDDCRMVSCSSTISPASFSVVPGESVAFELASASGLSGPPTVDITLGPGPDTAAELGRFSFTTVPAVTPFVGGYRGWRAILWNESEAFTPTQLLGDLSAIVFIDQGRLQQIARSIVPPRPVFAGAPTTGGNPAWMGSSASSFVSAAGLSASPVGGLGGNLFAGDYLRLSGTSSFYFGAGVQPVPGVSIDLDVSHSTTDTTTDVLDVNGDGVADVVAGAHGTLGAISSAASGAGASGLDFGDSFRHRVGLEYESGFGGKATVRTTTSGGRALTVDNPDGPDTGFLGLSGGIGLGLGRSQTTRDLIDVNGDGLPDLVERHGTTVSVRLNLGSRFGAQEPFGQVDAALQEPIDGFESDVEHQSVSFGVLDSTGDALQHETTISQHESGGFDLFGLIDFSHSSRQSASRTTREIADINGDGLPDLLYKKDGDPRIRVQINRGGDFAPVSYWPTGAWGVDLSSPFAADFLSLLGTVTGPDVLASTGSQDGSSYSASVSIPIIPDILSIGAGGSVSNDTDTYELALVDVDGDGAPDHVLRRGQSNDHRGTVYVKHNLITGRANLLREVDRPLGGIIALDYTRVGNTIDLPHSRQTLTKVTVDDGLDFGPAFASPNLVSTISYGNGLYDRGEKEFFGFASVITTRADGVTIEDNYENQTYALHGHLLDEKRRDAGSHLFQDHRVTYDVKPVLDASNAAIDPDPSCLGHLHPLLTADACTPRFPVVIEDDDTRSEGGAAQKTRTLRDTDHDRFGSVLVSLDSGDDAIATDDVYASASYLNDTGRWILGRPTTITVRAGSAAGSVLRSRAGDYDTHGDLTAIHVDTGTAAGIATTTLGYDAFGNLAHMTSPPNEAGAVQTYDVTYDAIAETYPATTTDGFGYTSTASYDLRFGVPTSEVDIDGATLTRSLDAFGRIATVRGPYDTAAPALTMEYHPEESPPRAVTVTQASAPPDYTGPVPAPITTVTAIDGLDHTIEMRKTTVVDAVVGMTTSGWLARDAVGRVVTSYHPLFSAGASTSFLPPTITLATTMTYDALDRVVAAQYPDGAIDAASFDLAPSPDGTLLFVSRAIDANGHPRETYVDHLGRSRAFVEHPSSTMSSISRYDYLPTGELASLVDAEGTTTTLGYDRRGLRTTFSNPDDGLIEEQFDAMGNRVVRIEPNQRALGTKIHYVYDRDRVVTIDYPSKPDVTFIYGGPGAPSGRAGRIAEIDDESGSQQLYYGGLGEVRRLVRTVNPGQPGRSPVSFDLRTTSDSLGRLLQIGYPDGEVVTDRYDAAGMLSSVAGVGAGWSHTYVDDLRYDVFGDRTHARAGNGTITAAVYDPARVRLSQLTTTLASSTKVQDLHYTYDAASNPIHIVNSLPALPPNGGTTPGQSDVTFTYDGVDQLTHAVGSASLAANKSTTYDEGFAYSPSHNLLHKQLTHLIQTPSGIPSAPSDTNFSSDYNYAPARPHLPTQVGDLTITYDPSGNPLTRRTTGSGNEQDFVWDDDNRLVDVTGSGTHQHNIYDAAGLRVLRKSKQGETIFSSPYFDLENGTQGVKHVFANGIRVASSLAKYSAPSSMPDANSPPPSPPSKPGTTYYFHDDNLGSTGVLTDDNGGIQESHEYFPDGEAWIDRGPNKPVTGYLFNGKPLDPDTGFYDFGQRFYDPRTSVWLGVDSEYKDSPTRAVGRPSTASPLSYAANSPARLRDPDGRGPLDGGYTDAWGFTHKTDPSIPPEVSDAIQHQSWDVPETLIEGTAVGANVFTEGTEPILYLVPGYDMLPAIAHCATGDYSGCAKRAAFAVGGYVAGRVIKAGVEGIWGARAAKATGAADSALTTRVGGAAASADAAADLGVSGASASAFSGLSRAAEFGIKPYKELRVALRGSGLQAHHLIEKRFAGLFGQTEEQMLSIAVTPAEHQTFTNAWRGIIPYGPTGTGLATRASVEQAARQVYAGHPEILKALGL